MRWCSPQPSIERARPLLGTCVAIRVRGTSPAAAHQAIDLAFAAIAEIHRLMSFQAATSDVSRINRDAAHAPVTVHPHTVRVLEWAARIAQLSEGLFDASIGGRLVEWGILAAPDSRQAPDARASFRDIELLHGRRVSLLRPLWLDLSGIAKGYAVDRAIAVLRRCGIASACVNAGGDLRTVGPVTEQVALRTAEAPRHAIPTVEIRDGALATSCGADTRRRHGGGWVSAHVAGRSGEAVNTATTVSVLTKRCVVADALTKVVLNNQAEAPRILRRLNAAAYIHHPDYPGSGWKALGELP
jgi:thiamine biosynthesis lipoprotein